MDKKIIESTFISRRPLTPILETTSPTNGNKVYKTILSECVIVGRAKQADISIEDGKLSRNHFMIVKSEGKYQIKDLNSTNGIVVNGKKVKKAVLIGNDKIIAGSSTFNFILARDDFNRNDSLLRSSPIKKDSFDKKYSKKKTGKLNKKTIFIALLVGLIVFGITWAILGGKDKAKVTPIVKKEIELKSGISVKQEIAKTKLSVEDKTKAANYFKLAEYHFKSRSYALAKKSIETYFLLVPESLIAPTFIAACEEALSKTKSIDDKLEEIERERQKRELIARLLKNGNSELNNENYNEAISIFLKVINIDSYNKEAYDGLIIAEKELKLQAEAFEIKEAPAPLSIGKIYARQMVRAFSRKDYTKAYELASRIKRMGQIKAGRAPFLKAMKISSRVIKRTNRMFAHMINEAELLSKSDATKAALKVYKRVLALFPYHSKAQRGIKGIQKKLHEKAKLLYAKALIEDSYPNTNEAKSKLRMILDLVPSSDTYHRKARKKLRGYKT